MARDGSVSQASVEPQLSEPNFHPKVPGNLRKISKNVEMSRSEGFHRRFNRDLGRRSRIINCYHNPSRL